MPGAHNPSSCLAGMRTPLRHRKHNCTKLRLRTGTGRARARPRSPLPAAAHGPGGAARGALPAARPRSHLSGPYGTAAPSGAAPATRPIVGSPRHPVRPLRLQPAPERPWVLPRHGRGPTGWGGGKGPRSRTEHSRHTEGRADARETSTHTPAKQNLSGGGRPPTHRYLTRPDTARLAETFLKVPKTPPRQGKDRAWTGGTSRPARPLARCRAERQPLPLTFPRLRLISSPAGCNFQSFPQLPSSRGAAGEGTERRGKVAAAAGIRWPWRGGRRSGRRAEPVAAAPVPGSAGAGSACAVRGGRGGGSWRGAASAARGDARRIC